MRNSFSVLLLMCVQLMAAQSDSVLIFVSDTQAPMPVEKLYLKDHDNVTMTQKILHAILQEKNVAAVIHAGDITSYGSSKKNWNSILPFLDSLKRRSIPFFAAKGNHDYYFLSGLAMKNFLHYLPDCSTDYYVRTFGRVAVIILNSNVEKLTENGEQLQRQWYDSLLQALDRDSTIHAIITVAHHPAFTNSPLVSGSKTLQRNFLPAFTASKKSVLMVNGHSHRFEHFRKNGKDFVVIGGGGGLFHNKKNPAEEEDMYAGADEGKFFHYMRCWIAKDSLTFDIVKVDAEGTKVVHQFKAAEQ
jgi:predicted phosphodiesterase